MNAPRLFCPRLATLAVRRTARPALLVGVALAAGLLARLNWAPASSPLPGEGGAIAGGVLLARGLARQAAWSLGLVAALPALTLAAARTFERWRRGEGPWLVAHAIAPRAVVVSTWTGNAAGAALLSLAFGTGVEVGLGPDGAPGLRLVWARSLVEVPRVEPGGALEVELAVPERHAPCTVRARLRSTYGDAPASEVAVAARRAVQRAARPGTRSEAPGAANDAYVLAGRAWLETAVADGAGPILWRVENRGPGALALVPDGTFEVWERTSSEALASAAIGARALLLAAVAGALALAFGAWLATTLAALASGTLLFALARSSPAAAGGDALGAALEHLGLGRVPALPGALALGAGAALVVGALFLATVALRRGRHAS